jgi:hypothetical protein
MFAGMKFAIGVFSENIYSSLPGVSLSTVIIYPKTPSKKAQTTTTRRRNAKSGTHTEREREKTDVIGLHATDAFPEPRARFFSYFSLLFF